MEIFLHQKNIETPLGSMVAIAHSQGLCFLGFLEQFTKKQFPHHIKKESNYILDFLSEELDQYFKKQLTIFKTPLDLSYQGTEFQQKAWGALLQIPYAQTISYQLQAQSIHKPTSHRAIANANAQNPLTIIIPCHRVIRASGSLGGYAGGVERKKWLLNHEKKSF